MNLIDRMHNCHVHDEVKLIILYGSQTGTAQDIAEHIAKQALSNGLPIRLDSMNMFETSMLPSAKYVVFVCSTTGNGEEPENMKKFWRFLLLRRHAPTFLSQTSFAVFGLGDSSYERYNYAAIKLRRRLEQLGAKMICDFGQGDDQHPYGIFGTFDTWLESLWKSLKLTGDFKFSAQKSVLEDSKFNLVLSCEDKKVETGSVTLLENTRLTPSNHFQDIRKLSFQVQNIKPEHVPLPGSVAYIYPQTDDETINYICSVFNWEPDSVFYKVSCGIKGFKVPENLQNKSYSIRQLFKLHLSPHSLPRRSLFSVLASKVSMPEMYRERLQELSSKEGFDIYFEYAVASCRTCVEVIRDFAPTFIKKDDSSILSPDYIFDIFPEIVPRAYSISSVKSFDKVTVFEIIIAIVEYKKILPQLRVGVCSRFIKTLNSMNVAVSWINSFPNQLSMEHALEFLKPLENSKRPILAVCTGTGLAPIFNLLQWRISRGEYENYLFYGCRGEFIDFCYGKELVQLRNDKKIKLFTAFSRDQKQKIYVQDRLHENSNLVSQLILDQGSCVYIVGSSKYMPKAVNDAILSSIRDNGFQGDQQKADEFWKKFKSSLSYHEEVWS